MKEDIEKSLAVLKKGGTILYPTDTLWGIGCDATNKAAVKKIFKIKKRVEKKSMIILLDDLMKIPQYVDNPPDIAWDLLEKFDRPTTVIYPKAINIAKHLAADDGSIAIRIVKHPFCNKLLEALDRPIVSSSANISGEKTPILFSEISLEIKEKVDYIVQYQQEKIEQLKASTLIRINKDGSYDILRD